MLGNMESQLVTFLFNSLLQGIVLLLAIQLGLGICRNLSAARRFSLGFAGFVLLGLIPVANVLVLVENPLLVQGMQQRFSLRTPIDSSSKTSDAGARESLAERTLTGEPDDASRVEGSSVPNLEKSRTAFDVMPGNAGAEEVEIVRGMQMAKKKPLDGSENSSVFSWFTFQSPQVHLDIPANAVLWFKPKWILRVWLGGACSTR